MKDFQRSPKTDLGTKSMASIDNFWMPKWLQLSIVSLA